MGGRTRDDGDLADHLLLSAPPSSGLHTQPKTGSGCWLPFLMSPVGGGGRLLLSRRPGALARPRTQPYPALPAQSAVTGHRLRLLFSYSRRQRKGTLVLHTTQSEMLKHLIHRWHIRSRLGTAAQPGASPSASLRFANSGIWRLVIGASVHLTQRVKPG